MDLLEQLGHQPVLSHPKQTRAIAAARLKHDRVDAERLVQLLRGDLLPTVWIPQTAVREARELIRHRVSLVRERTGVTNRLLALLARRNLQPTSGQRWSTVPGQRELKALPLPPIPTTIREDCLALCHLLDEQIRRLDQELVARWGDDVRVRRLVTIPGIGPFIALRVVLELVRAPRAAVGRDGGIVRERARPVSLGSFSLDMCVTCRYVLNMPKMIQLRHVPDDLHRKLKARAALAGLSLSDYLLQEVRRTAERPTVAELRARLVRRTPVITRVPPAKAVRAERERR